MKKIRCIIIFTYSFLLATAVTVGRRIHFCGNVSGGIHETYFTRFLPSDILVELASIILIAGAIFLILRFSNNIHALFFSSGKPVTSERKVFISSWIVIFVLWLPYILTFAPGSIFTDSLSSLTCSWNDNHHPILYNAVLKCLYNFGLGLGSPNIGIFFYTILQSIILSAIFSYTLLRIHRLSVRRWLFIAAVIFFGLFPVFPFYAIAVWKDPLFSSALLVLCFLLWDLNESYDNSFKPYAYIAATVFAVCFTRNNGIPIILGSAVILLLFNGLKSKNVRIFLLSAALCMLIQGPGYRAIGIRSLRSEALGMQLQQLSYTAAYESDSLTEEEYDTINNIMPIECIKKQYTPCIADSIKWSPDFNGDYFESNAGHILVMWVKMIPRHFNSFVKATLLDDLGFWHVNLQNSFGYFGPEIADNNLGIYYIDLVKSPLSVSLASTLASLPEIISVGSGTLFWITFLSFCLCCITVPDRRLFFYVPQLLCWAIIMVGTPVAFSLRYVVILLFAMPVNIILPFYIRRDC